MDKLMYLNILKNMKKIASFKNCIIKKKYLNKSYQIMRYIIK